MDEALGGDDPLKLIHAVLERQEQEKENESDFVIKRLKMGVFPTPEAVVRILVWRSGADRAKLIRHHAYWKERGLRMGFEALVSAALVAHLDLTRAEAALTAYAESREAFKEHMNHTINNPAQKEVMAFCAAYSGAMNVIRRLKKCRLDISDKIEDLINNHLIGDEFDFICELRNNLSHGAVIVPGFTVTSKIEGMYGLININIDDLLCIGDWKKSKNFIKSFGRGGVNISQITRICSNGLVNFRRDIDLMFKCNLSDAERDYFDIEDLTNRIKARSIMKAFINFAYNRKIDPYKYIHKWYSDEVVREILRYKKNSIEQVDYMILQKSLHVDFDDELKGMFYKLFNVDANVNIVEGVISFGPPPLDVSWPLIRS